MDKKSKQQFIEFMPYLPLFLLLGVPALASIVKPENLAEFIKKMAEIVSQKNGTMIKQDVWGKRRLAYPIKKFEEGFYVFFTYESEGNVSLELERLFKQTDTVLRFLTVKKDTRDPARRRKKVAEAPAASPAPAAVEEGAEDPPAENAAAEVKEEE